MHENVTINNLAAGYKQTVIDFMQAVIPIFLQRIQTIMAKSCSENHTGNTHVNQKFTKETLKNIDL